MRRLSANYIFPITSKPLKNGILEIDDNGKIINIIDTNGKLAESQNLEFYNGILVPGFINTHCHLELSYLKNKVSKKTGLIDFISYVSKSRNLKSEEIISAAFKADKEMYNNGIVASCDISNFDYSFNVKKQSKIYYHTFIEVFGLSEENNNSKINNAIDLLKKLDELKLSGSISPHSTYSLNQNLFRELKKLKNNLISIHNQESDSENELYKNNSGKLFDFFNTFSDYKFPKTGFSSVISVSKFLKRDTRTLFVHNTFTNNEDLKYIKSHFSDFYFSFCPNSNLYIENKLPDFLIFDDFIDKITIGTDSLSSNTKLDILQELKTLNKSSHFSLNQLLQFATINAAKFLNLNNKFGSFEVNKTPGINLISELNLKNLTLSNDSRLTKLI